ncbi:MAG: hypothetical protein ACW98Y_16435 [Candidatus Thorarchaeota archaeon]
MSGIPIGKIALLLRGEDVLDDLRNGDCSIQGLVMNVNLDDIRPLHLSPTLFQEYQLTIQHQTVFRKSATRCSFVDTLAEFLRVLPMAVVYDTQTSWSRTTWLATSLNDVPILIVLDSYQSGEMNYVSIDLWCDIDSMDVTLRQRLGESVFGEMGHSFTHLKIDWDLAMKTETSSQIIITLSSDLSDDTEEHNLYLCATYSNFTTEDFQLRVPLIDSKASISIETVYSEDSLPESLDDIYFSIFVSDALWKPLEKKYALQVTWRDVITTQIERQLKKGTRFSSFLDLQEALGFSFIEDGTIVPKYFIELSLDNSPESCEHQRLTDYCKRSTLLSWLVTCFNPERGLSGYLEMISTPQVYGKIKDLGTQRTWMEHISELSHIAEDFTPTQIKLRSTRKSKKRGRPPTQLIPGPPLIGLFKKLIDEPELSVCRNCRFKS